MSASADADVEQLRWMRRRVAEDAAAALAARGFPTRIAGDQGEALRAVLEQIPEGATVGFGGSMTLEAIGAVDAVRSGPYRIIDRYRTGSWDETMEAYKRALGADIFLTGVNAITKTGELLCVDSSGNRAAAMIFGPSRVIVVAGVNKVVEDLAAAFARLRRIAPLNCRRLGHKTPCAELGVCVDCMIPERMCNYTAIIHDGLKEKERIRVVLVTEELGF
ncbi:MAG: lactate utilization protein [Spirochaetaceae bacterium]|nr:lactate utilization protein [Spirochaetaceae bacterium]